MTLSDKNLNDGMLLIGEKGLISIKKIEKEKELWNFKEFCPICNLFETTYTLNIPGVETFRDYCKVKNTEKENFWIAFRLKNDYDSIKNKVETLTRENFEIKVIKETLVDIDLMSKTFVLAFKKDDLKIMFDAKKISKKIILEVEKMSLNIIKKAIYKKEGYSYDLKYFKLNRKSLETVNFNKIFFGPNLKESGIEEFLKKSLNEEFVRPLTTLKIPNTKTFLTNLWKELYLTPKLIQKNMPEIKVNDLKEIVELEYKEERELFSKTEFSTEIFFCEDGELGKILKQYLRNRINETLKILK